MNDVDELATLEQRLLSLQQEEAQRADAVEAACRARLASPSSLLLAGVAGAALGLLGGGGRRDAVKPPPQVAAASDGNVWLGGLLALAGAAGAVVRILELGALIKADRRRD